MSPIIFNVGLFLDRRYMDDVVGLFCTNISIKIDISSEYF